MEIINLKDRRDLIDDAISSIKKYHENDFVNDSENILNYVLLENNKIIGEVDYSYIAPTADLLFIYLINEKRGQGLSKEALNETFDLLKEKGINEVFLEVRVSNTIAKNLYTKMSFKELGTRKKYYSNGEDAIVMRVEL